MQCPPFNLNLSCKRGTLVSYRLLNAARLYCRDAVWSMRYIRRRFVGGNKLPQLLCNSYPQSGTHLLAQILGAVPGYRLWNDIVAVQSLSGTMNTARHIRWKLGSVPGGSVVRAHLPFDPQILKILKEREYTRFLIYRDLRDIAASRAEYIIKEKRVYLYDLYRNHLCSRDKRLMACINGIYPGTPFGSNLSQPPIGQDFSKWHGWLSDPDTLCVRFEDLVGSRGGGSDEVRFKTIGKIFEKIGIEISAAEIEKRFSAEQLDPRAMHTFRKGRIGGWREFYKNEHIEAFKRSADRYLIELGYEKDTNWPE